MAEEPKNELNQIFDYNNLLNNLRYISLNVSFLMRRAEKIFKRMNINKYIDKVSQRPWLAVALIITTSLTIIFIATFVLLVLITSTIALTGIVLIEGTIITIGTVILFGCIASIWIIVGVIAVTGAIFYHGTLYFHTHFYSLQANETSLKKFDNIQRILYDRHEQSIGDTRTDNIQRDLDEKLMQVEDVSKTTDNTPKILDEKNEHVTVVSKKTD